MKVFKYYPKTSFGDATFAIVSASDSSTLSVFTNKEVKYTIFNREAIDMTFFVLLFVGLPKREST